MISTRFTVVAGMVLVGMFCQVLPHPMNFSPIGAVALLSGARFDDKRLAFIVPLSAMFISDMVVGVHPLMPFVYGSFALTVALGFILRGKNSVSAIAGASFLSAVLFFVITNFGVWALLNTFPKSLGGLVACYVTGLPYLGSTLLSQFVYGALLFGGFALAQHRCRPAMA